ncbi:MAG: YihY/virulence factor BrkB family protein [Rubellimicrobium sp.]|nr:YihY/virulence factor BrkB family protein [Rubellimicrobium sp.]
MIAGLAWGALKGAGRIAWAVWTVSSRTHMGLIAAGVAFYGFFALFPGMAALIAVFGLISDPEIVQTEIELLRDFIPEQAYELIAAQLERLLLTSGTTLRWATIVSFAVALWSARAGVSAVVQGLNAIYDIPNRSGIRHEILSLVMTLALMAIAVVALLIVVVAPIVMAIFPPYPALALLLEGLRWGVALAVLVTGLWMLYRYGPNRAAEGVLWMTPGALAVVMLWFGASWGLGTYLANFGRYNEIYGSIGAVIALLLWLYVSAWLILAGAALNAVIERLRRRRQSRQG